jgi:hypothetical protein
MFIILHFQFYIILYFIISLIIAAISAHIAISRGYSGITWYIMAFICNIFSIIGIITNPSRKLPIKRIRGLTRLPKTYQDIHCHLCESPNHPAAKSCSSCKHVLEPVIESETDRVWVS